MKDKDSAEEYLRLLACICEDTANQSLNCIVPFAREFLFDDPDSRISELRREEDERINRCIEPYRSLMDQVEQDWCDCVYLIDESGISYPDSGESLPKTTGLLAEQLESDYAGIYMTASEHSTRPVRSTGFPTTTELQLAQEYYVNRIPVEVTGISVYLRIPDGRDMLMYHQENGNLVLCELPEDILDTLSSHYGIPFFYEDDVVKPFKRVDPFCMPDGSAVEILFP